MAIIIQSLVLLRLCLYLLSRLMDGTYINVFVPNLCKRDTIDYIRILRLYDEHVIILLRCTLVTFHNFNKEALIITSMTSRIRFICYFHVRRVCLRAFAKLMRFPVARIVVSGKIYLRVTKIMTLSICIFSCENIY